ncbi:MAG: glycosyltransferase family 4 protein [Candidatus Omnitrophota bacterium]
MQPDAVSSKTIWLFNQYAITPGQAGGSRHYAIAKRLAQRGYRVTLFASGFNYQERRETKCTGEEPFTIENHEGVRFVWVKTTPYSRNNWRRILNMLSYCRQCLRIYQKLLSEERVEKPGVIIGSAVHLFAVWTAYFLSKRLKSTFIMEVRDLWPLTLVEFRRSLRFHPVVFALGRLDRFLSRRACRIISVLPGGFDYYQRYGIARERVVWIPNGVETHLYTSDAGESPERFKIVYTGTFGMEASLHTLLEAAALIRERGLPIYFELTGSGERKSELVAMRDRLQLANVEFFEPVRKEEIPRLLAGASALWIGSRNVKNLYRYGFSFNKLFEYLAAGKPILFCIDSWYNPVQEVGAGFVIPPEDPDALCESIIRLYEMPVSERIEMGRKGMAYAQAFHDMDILADRFDALLSQLEH